MNKTICVKKSKATEWWIAEYTTLDVVTQGETKIEALINLLEIITIHIDYAVENGNISNVLPVSPRSNKALKPDSATSSRCISCDVNWKLANYCGNCGKKRPAA